MAELAMTRYEDFYVKQEQVSKNERTQTFLVKHKQTGDVHVMKVVLKMWTNPQSFPNRLLALEAEKNDDQARRGIQTLAMLRHKNIIEYINFFEDDKNYYLITEHCERGSLADIIATKKKKKETFTEDEIFDILIQLLSALSYIHARKIVHRGIKPQNAFLTKDHLVKIGDFGICRDLNIDDFATTKIELSGYMSPEMYEGKRYDFKSDIWSLGVLLYELACLKLPFPTDNPVRMFRQMQSGRFDPVPASYSPSLQDLIGEMLRLDPRTRPSVDELLQEDCIVRRLERAGRITTRTKLLQRTMRSTIRHQGHMRVNATQQSILSTVAEVEKALQPSPEKRGTYSTEDLSQLIRRLQLQIDRKKLESPAPAAPKMPAEALCVISLGHDMDTYIWSPEDNQWKEFDENSDDFFVNENATSILVDQQLFVMSGSNRKLYSKNLAPNASGPWVEKASLVHGRCWPSCLAHNGFIYALGGMNVSGWTICGLFERYNIAKNEWEQLPSALTPIRHASLFTMDDNKIYAVGGDSVRGMCQSLQIFDVASSTWQMVKQGIDRWRVKMPLAVLDGKIYISIDNVLYTYDHRRYGTSRLATWPADFIGGAMTTWCGKVVIIKATDVCVYDPATKTFTRLPQVPCNEWTSCFTLKRAS